MSLWPASVARELAPAGLRRRSCVGAVECNEAAIFAQPIESRAKDQDQKIVRTRPEPSPAPTEPSGSKLLRHRLGAACPDRHSQKKREAQWLPVFLAWCFCGLLLWRGSLLPLGSVGADECNEAAIFPLTLESLAKDQKIAGFASSYRAQREQSLTTKAKPQKHLARHPRRGYSSVARWLAASS